MKTNVLIIVTLAAAVTSLEICPYTPIKKVIRATIEEFDSATEQMVMIRAVMEDLTKATWGVIIVEDPVLVASEVHWTVPDVWRIGGKGAFCVTVVNGWQYNVFMIHDEQLKQERLKSSDHYSFDIPKNKTHESEFFPA